MIPGHKSELIIQFVRYNKEDRSLYSRLDDHWRRNELTEIHIEDSRLASVTCIHPVYLFTSRPRVTQKELVTYFDAAGGFDSQILVKCTSIPMHRKNYLQSVKLSVTVADLLRARSEEVMKKVACG